MWTGPIHGMPGIDHPALRSQLSALVRRTDLMLPQLDGHSNDHRQWEIWLTGHTNCHTPSSATLAHPLARPRVRLPCGRPRSLADSSGADDELTLKENQTAFQRCWLKPRVLVDVKTVDTGCAILGIPSSMPVYLSAVAM